MLTTAASSGVARRSLVAAAMAPLAGAAAATLPQVADPEGERFLAWELEFHRLHAEADAIPGEEEEAADAIYARAQAIEELILVVRSASPSAIRVKLRALIRCAELGAEEMALALRDVLAHIEANA